MTVADPMLETSVCKKQLACHYMTHKRKPIMADYATFVMSFYNVMSEHGSMMEKMVKSDYLSV